MNAKPRIIIGIDPDVEASGLGIVNLTGRKVITNYSSHPLPELVTTLAFLTSDQRRSQSLADKILSDKIIPEVSVYIEAGWLNQGNWHVNPSDNKKIAAAKGRQAGRNHQLGLDLCALLEHQGIQHQLVRPLQKCWKGKDRKITHAELDAIVRWVNREGLPRKRSNQEERDALLIAWVQSGLPIHC